jgi:exodeoxyribonuclease VII large subunit
MPEKHFTLLQLNKSIQKLIQTVQQDFWITAELATAQLGEHAYLELVQKEGDKIVAKARAIVWNSVLGGLFGKFGDGLGLILKAGSKVMIRVTVSFHEVHGLALVVTDVDASYTIGALELQRQQTIARLEQAGLTGRQKLLPLPLVLQRVAIISSETAAGYSDFVDQLRGNPYRYGFALSLLPAQVQGERAEAELAACLRQVGPDYDAVVLIRGGGSRLDLEVFNSYAVALAVAECPMPVLTGIGHLRDTTVADLVAHSPFKTPTAVAEFIVQHNAQFEAGLGRRLDQVLLASQALVGEQKNGLQELSAQISRHAGQALQQASYQLIRQREQLGSLLKFRLKTEATHLAHTERALANLDPEAVLRRGYTLTLRGGVPLRSAEQLQPGDELVTLWPGWQVASTVASPPEATDREP